MGWSYELVSVKFTVPLTCRGIDSPTVAVTP